MSLIDFVGGNIGVKGTWELVYDGIRGKKYQFGGKFIGLVLPVYIMSTLLFPSPSPSSITELLFPLS
jgi:hypothetical protein